MRKTTRLLLLSAMLCSGGCLLPRQHVLPDQSVPHRLAKPETVWIWVRRPDGDLVQEKVRVEAGWWVAAPSVVE